MAVAEAPVAAALATTAAVLFFVAVVSAAFFLVGIVAFRSVGAAACGAAALLEILTASGSGLVAAVAAGLAGSTLASTRIFASGFAMAPLRTPVGALAPAFPASTFALTALDLASFGKAFDRALVARCALVDRCALVAACALAAGRALVVVALFAEDRAAVVLPAGLIALVRLTDDAGWVAVRAAALDVAEGLTIPPEAAFAALAVFAATRRAGDLVERRSEADVFPVLVLAAFVAAFDAAGFVAACLDAEAPAALRFRAAGLVLGDISATPEIGRTLSCVIGDNVPRASRHEMTTSLQQRRFGKLDLYLRHSLPLGGIAERVGKACGLSVIKELVSHNRLKINESRHLPRGKRANS